MSSPDMINPEEQWFLGATPEEQLFVGLVAFEDALRLYRQSALHSSHWIVDRSDFVDSSKKVTDTSSPELDEFKELDRQLGLAETDMQALVSKYFLSGEYDVHLSGDYSIHTSKPVGQKYEAVVKVFIFDDNLVDVADVSVDHGRKFFVTFQDPENAQKPFQDREHPFTVELGSDDPDVNLVWSFAPKCPTTD